MRTFRLKTFSFLLLFFAATQALGIFVAQKISLNPQAGSIKPEQIANYTLVDLITIILAATIFILIVIKFRRTGAWIFRVVASILILGGFQTVGELFLPSIWAFLIAAIAVILFHFFNNLIIQNIVMIISLAGLGALLGLSLTPLSVVVTLAVLSFYDIWAVYKTKHMVAMAETMINARAISGFVLPDADDKNFLSKTDQFKPGSGFMLLGSGDIVLPILFSASLVSFSIYQATLVAIFSCVGLFLMYWILVSQKNFHPMAALPPIAALSIIGYLVSFL